MIRILAEHTAKRPSPESSIDVWFLGGAAGCLFKKRLARPSGGKSGGFRTIVGYRRPNSERIIFLYAFAKNVRGNITGREEAALSLAAEAFLSATDCQVEQHLAEGFVWEVLKHE